MFNTGIFTTAMTDPLVDKAAAVMKENNTRRKVTSDVLKEFGAQSRQSIPAVDQPAFQKLLDERIAGVLNENYKGNPAKEGSEAAKKDDAERDCLKKAGKKIPSRLSGIKEEETVEEKVNLKSYIKKHKIKFSRSGNGLGANMGSTDVSEEEQLDELSGKGSLNKLVNKADRKVDTARGAKKYNQAKIDSAFAKSDQGHNLKDKLDSRKKSGYYERMKRWGSYARRNSEGELTKEEETNNE